MAFFLLRSGSTAPHKTSLFDPTVDRDFLRVTTFLAMDDGKFSLDFWDPTWCPPPVPSAPVVHTCAAPIQHVVKASTKKTDLRALRLLRTRRLLLPPKVALSYEERKKKRARDCTLMPRPSFIPANAVKRYYAEHHARQVDHVLRVMDGERPARAAAHPQPSTSIWGRIVGLIPSCLKRKRISGDDETLHKRPRLVPGDEADSDVPTPPRRTNATPRRVAGRRSQKLAPLDLPAAKAESAAILSIFDRFVSTRDTPAAQSAAQHSMPIHWAQSSLSPQLQPYVPRKISIHGHMRVDGSLPNDILRDRRYSKDLSDLQISQPEARSNRESCSSWIRNAVRDFFTSDWDPVVSRYPYVIDEFNIYEVLPVSRSMEVG